MLNKRLFRAAVVRSGMTLGTLSKMLHISKNTMTSRVSGRTEFRVDEIEAICNAIGITDASEKCEIFLSGTSQ